MAEAAALNLASDVTKSIGDVLMGRAIQEMKMVWGLKDDLEKLKSKFSNLQLFLKDVGNSRNPDNRCQVIEWLLQVKDAAYAADDIIDDYDYEIVRREREQKKEFVKRFQGFFSRNNNPVLFRFRMSRRVSDVLASFDALDISAKKMGLRQLQITAEGIAGTSASANNAEGSDKLSQTRQHAAASATEFVGREDEEKKLLKILCRPINDQEGYISTVAIRGIGGFSAGWSSFIWS